MKRVFAADFFEFRKSKMTYILPLVSVLLGFFLPMLYYSLSSVLNNLGTLDILQDQNSLTAVNALLDSLNAREVFLSVLPLSQGVGFIAAAMIGYRAVRQFGNGVYRNKVIAQVPRAAIYLSQSFYSFILMIVSATLYTLTAALTSRLAFGELILTKHEILVVTLLSLGIYIVYTAVPIFVAFYTRTVPLTILISLLEPILTQTIVSFINTALLSVPKVFIELLAILPSFQNMYLMSATASNKVLAISLASDCLIVAVLTAFGIIRFKKSDIN